MRVSSSIVLFLLSACAAAATATDGNVDGNGIQLETASVTAKLNVLVPHASPEVQESNVGDSETTKDQVLRTRTGMPSLKHYGPPPGGCEDDETAFQISGIAGGVCSAKCTDFLPCPTDVPAGVTATPMCALENGNTGDKYCVLICNPELDDRHNLRGGDSQCGDATCRAVPGAGVGVCTYDE
mmetsp:Transcript_20966/g.59831  ORF Transcript_20966/g.59831 Transcript_20966/m.59831 type:complete len:183 (+) Transcript_20966:622-1170(+)